MAYKTLTLDLLLTCLRGGGRLGAGLGAALIPFSLGSYIYRSNTSTYSLYRRGK